jgi:CRISPR-associated protein Csb2
VGAEGAALRWLETLGDPELHLPPRDAVFCRSNVTVYVPVNDSARPVSAALQSAPVITRSRQPRTFPRVWVGHEPCCMSWPEAKGIELHDEALHRLCAKVTRIGHSSSLVRMWVARAERLTSGLHERWVAGEELADQHCRVVAPGALDSLPGQTLIPRILQFADLDRRIRSSKGAEQKSAKAEFAARLGVRWTASAKPPPLLRPKLGLWSGYRRGLPPAAAEVCYTLFDPDVLVLVHDAGPCLPLVSTLAVTRALRGTVMACSDPPPAWISGHERNGAPLRSDNDGHLALVPLPFVGREHADGHLLGVGLVFPRSVERRERGRVLGKLLVDESGQSRPVDLKLGRLGVWTVRKRDWSESRLTLAPESWTAHPGGAYTWASVTPIVLDRFPKSDRRREREAWTSEVAEIVVAACVRIGLPETDGSRHRHDELAAGQPARS